MRVSWKWLNELVDIQISPEELVEKLTFSGIEVDLEYMQSGIAGVITALIEKIVSHPQADKLLLCQVNPGNDQLLTIVTGATNLKEGCVVPLALIGAVLPGGKRIGKTMFRGIESEGMLCSAEELGIDADKLLPEQKEGILILPSGIKPGEDIIKVLNLDDAVLELDLTPNRSDCLSMLNVAREVAALTGAKVKVPEVINSEPNELTKINIWDNELCPRYVARIIKDVNIAPSPQWLQNRLIGAGVRPINNVVDVTNYVLMEMGQPLHAFDYDELEENRIIVRRAKPGERLITLDGQDRELSSDMLVIADGVKPVALAGVMGGFDTEITAKTNTILLESAVFNGPCVRRTSQALGIRSEASIRFEKTVDIEQVVTAADRAVQLIAELGAGTPLPGHVDCYPVKKERTPIVLRLEKIEQLLGLQIEAGTIEKILEDLNIKVMEQREKSWLVMTPSYRKDLEIEVDLIEEIARLYGYDKIPTTLPYGATTQGMRTSEQSLRQHVCESMVAQGFYEVLTYSFINPRHLEWLRLSDDDKLRDFVTVKNPLSEEQGIMRTTIVPALLQMIKINLNKHNRNGRLFELGKVYFKEGFPEENVLPLEKWVLGGAVTGKQEKTWISPELDYNYFYLKGVLDNLLDSIGVEESDYVKTQLSWLHPGRSASLLVDGREIGCLGEIHPLVLEKYGIEQRVTVFTLDVKALQPYFEKLTVYETVPKYPPVNRDLAVVVPEEVNSSEIAKVIRGVGQDLLQEVRFFDLYRGVQLGIGKKSLAYSLTWQAKDRTLTDEEINALHEKIEKLLNEASGAEIRRI